MASSPQQAGRAPSPFLSHGFRPFFLGAGWFGALAVALWLLVYRGRLGLASPLSPIHWHGHEMLFGYASAVLAGFLLTATPTWSGTPPVSGARLALLALLWLAGRLAMMVGASLPAAAALVDLAFLPALALALLPALERAGRRNLVFLPMLGALVLANLGIHLDALGFIPGLASPALLLALDLYALLIALVGGRIVPAFTANALRARGEATALRPFDWRDRLALAASVALVLVDLAVPGPLAGMVALLAGLLHAFRLSGWETRRTLRQPILWVLHLGYAWLALGLVWRGTIQLLADLPAAAGLHGLAVGAVGTMTLAVMSRAALGHSGRPLEAPAGVVASYVLVSVAAAARLATPLLPAALFWLGLVVTALAWSLALLLFALTIGPILVRPRAPGGSVGKAGRPGD